MISWTEERIVGVLQRGNVPVTVRPIRPSDLTLIMEMHGRLSAESILARYLGPRIPNPEAINNICHLAPETGAGFVATVQRNDGGQSDEIVIGLAYYIREAQEAEATAELGILVEDQFQGQGIGRSLWRVLHSYAQANQIRWLHVLCHPSNQRILRLLRSSGFAYQAKANWRLREYLIELGKHPERTQTNPQRRTTSAFEHATVLAKLQGQWRIKQDALSLGWAVVA